GTAEHVEPVPWGPLEPVVLATPRRIGRRGQRTLDERRRPDRVPEAPPMTRRLTTASGRLAIAALGVLLIALSQPAAQARTRQPKAPTRDSGLFLNILPAGQGTSTTVPEAAQFFATGQLPPHDADQLSMYDTLPRVEPVTDAK